MKRRTLVYLAAIIVVNTVLIVLGVNILLRASGASTPDTPIARSVNVPQGDSFPEQTLRFTRFTYHSSTHELAEVELEVENVTTETQRGVVWYILAPPGDPEPWRTAVFSAPEQTVEVEPGQRVTVTLPPPDADTPEGEYHLSAWAHGIRADQRFHSDGAGAPQNVFLGPEYSFRIIEVAQTSASDPILSVTFYARNNMSQPITLEMSYTLSTPNVGRPWENALYTLPFKETQLDPGEEYVVTYRDAVTLPDGDYQLIGWLHQALPGQETVEIARYVYPELIQNP